MNKMLKNWLIRQHWAYTKQGEPGPEADTVPRRRKAPTPTATPRCETRKPRWGLPRARAV